MKYIWLYVMSFCALALATANADLPPSAASPVPSASAAGGHVPNPCEILSQRDIASAAGVATNQVFAPTSATKDECVWAIGSTAGVPGQRVALSLQAIDQGRRARGFARLGALMSVVQSVRGMPMVSNPIVSRAFADAQMVANLGDRAGWNNGTLSVLKNELLFQVAASGQSSNAASFEVAKSIAQSVLYHLQAP